MCITYFTALVKEHGLPWQKKKKKHGAWKGSSMRGHDQSVHSCSTRSYLHAVSGSPSQLETRHHNPIPR